MTASIHHAAFSLDRPGAVTFARAFVESPIGRVSVVTDSAERVVAVDFEDHEDRLRALLQRRHGPNLVAPAVASSHAVEAIEAFFAGDLLRVDELDVHTGGTAFERTVWATLRRIPVGTTWSYGDVAAAIGRPNACRAVGRANGANPVGIVLPCHRVVGADGSLTGYAGGIERKRWLLDHERRA